MKEAMKWGLYILAFVVLSYSAVTIHKIYNITTAIETELLSISGELVQDGKEYIIENHGEEIKEVGVEVGDSLKSKIQRWIK